MDHDEPTRPQPPQDPRPDRDPRLDAETARFPRPEPDQTSILPPTEDPSAPAAARWSARAGVPTGRPREPLPHEQEWVPAQQPRTWWAPILIIVAIVVLLALVGLGLWLAIRGQQTPTSAPSVSPSAVASSASPSPSPSPTPSPTAAASPTPATVAVPSVTGVMLTDAQQILQSQGLKSRVVTEVTDQQPAGSVVRTDPGAGATVRVGSTVTLYVATAPATSAAPSPSPSGSGR